MTVDSVPMFLSRDEDTHWYLIPRSHEVEWNKWLDDTRDGSDESIPSYAICVDGNPSRVTILSWEFKR